MKRLKLFTVLFFVTSMVFAQINTPAPSPGANVSQAVGLIDVTVEYSRPGKRGRDIFGALVPYDQLWRTGANAATKITFSGDVQIGGTSLKAGDYAILTLPGKSSWKVNFYPYEGGNFGMYTEKTPAASVSATPTSTSQTESFTIGINNISAEGASLDFSWDQTLVSVPFTVGTDKTVMSQIEGLEASIKNGNANNYHNAATYLFNQKKELEKALAFENKAVELRPDAFWMSRQKALILAELGKTKEAIAAAEMSKKAAQDANNQNYIDMNTQSIAEWSKKK